MFGMSHESYLLLDAVVTIIGLIVLITRFKVHPFIALIIAAGFLGLTSGMPVDKIIKAFQDGFGGVLGFVGIILALGTMLGKMMAESGGADQIAQTLIRAFGKEKVQWAMMFAAFLVGIPLFFEIGFVLLIPLVFIVARRTGVSLIKIGIPLLAGLSAVHGLVPPHPGPLLAIGVFGADIGKTILYGLIVALPTAINLLFSGDCAVHQSSELTGAEAASLSARLQVEIECAYADIMDYATQIRQLIDHSQLDRALLTTVRLQLAQLRLVHGAAVNRVYRHLLAFANPAERAELDALRMSRQRLLQEAAAHAGQWSLEAVASNWYRYRLDTRAVIRRFVDLMIVERRTLDQMLARTASRC